MGTVTFSSGGGLFGESHGKSNCPPRESFPELEDELCAMTGGGFYAGPGKSPDRADAMVWALTELMLGREGGAPRVFGF